MGVKVKQNMKLYQKWHTRIHITLQRKINHAYPNNMVGMKSRPDVESTIGSNLSWKTKKILILIRSAHPSSLK